MTDTKPNKNLYQKVIDLTNCQREYDKSCEKVRFYSKQKRSFSQKRTELIKKLAKNGAKDE